MLKLSYLCRKYLYWWLLFLSAFIPLYPKLPVLNVPNTYVAIRVEDFLIAASLLCLFLAILPNLRSFLKKLIVCQMLLYWLIGGLSLFSGIFLTQTVVAHLGVFHFLRRIELMLLFFLAYKAITSIRQVKTWVWVMMGVTLAVSLYGFGQEWLSFPVISTTNKEFSKGLILSLSEDARINSTFAGHYDLAAYLAVFLAIFASMIIYFKTLQEKAAAVLISLLGFISLALTAARVSFVAAILGISLSLFLIGQKKLIIVLFGLALLAFVFSPDLRHRTVATLTVNLLGGGGAKYTPPPQKPGGKGFSIENAASGTATPAGVPIDIAPGEPLNTTELGVFRSFGIRLNEEWPRAIRAFYKNPFLGTGYSSITIATDNDYLRSLGETGLLGTLSLLLIWFTIVKRITNYLKKAEKDFSFYFICGILSAIIVVAVNAIFIDILESSKIASLIWLSLGVGLALIDIKLRENKID